jgi:hypothetical protein
MGSWGAMRNVIVSGSYVDHIPPAAAVPPSSGGAEPESIKEQPYACKRGRAAKDEPASSGEAVDLRARRSTARGSAPLAFACDTSEAQLVQMLQNQ